MAAGNSDGPDATTPQPDEWRSTDPAGTGSDPDRTVIDKAERRAAGAKSGERRGSHSERIGQRLGKYEIREFLGAGGMGAVYRAYDESLSREVAIKILPKDGLENTFSDRFRAEAKAAGQLSNPHVVAIHEIGEDDDTHYIAMELVDGGSTADELERRGPFPVVEATRITADACRGLMAAHQLGLVHRDINPSNLLKTKSQLVKVADFGLAKGGSKEIDPRTTAGEILGTPYFMSPEQCEGAPADKRSDIYSLGATYYTLLTGVKPHAEAKTIVQVMLSHCSDKVLDASRVNPHLPHRCAAIIKKATARNPDKRYQTADEMLADLEGLLSHMSGVSQERKRSGWIKTWAQKKRRVVMASIALAALVAGAALLLPRKPLNLSQGVTKTTITFGTTTAYSGPNKELGRAMVVGIRMCFKEVNEKKIHGRELELEVLDDKYDPKLALENMKTLFEVKKVFATIGNVGTPTAEVTMPYSTKKGFLFFAPFSGASLLRADPTSEFVFNFRASYSDETAAIVKYFVESRDISPEKISVFAQEDMFGEDCFQGVFRALRNHEINNPKDVLRVGYKRNTVEVEPAVEKIVSQIEKIDAIIMAATYRSTAKFVKLIKEHLKKQAGDKEILFAAVSFVGSRALAEAFQVEGGEYGEGVIVSQVVPHHESSARGVNRYRELLKKHYPEEETSFVSLEGFIAAECLVEGLRAAGRELNTKSLIEALETIEPFDLGVGPKISFEPNRHQASTKVWGTILDKDGNYKTLDLE